MDAAIDPRFVPDKILFGIDDEAVVSPGWKHGLPTPDDYEDVEVTDSRGKTTKFKVQKGDRRIELVEKAIEKEATLNKALSISGFSGTLIPVYVDPAIVDITRKETPVVELIPRVANRGKSADFNRITALGTTGFQAEDASLSEANDTLARKSATIYFAYQVGRVTGPMQAASAEYIDAMNFEVLNKTKNLRYIEEQTILVGNGSSVVSTMSDGSTLAPWNSQSFSGLVLQQEGTSVNAGQNIWSTVANNLQNVSGGNLALAHIRAGIEAAEANGGRPKLIVTDVQTVRIIKGLMQEQQRLVDTTEFAWGITAISLDGLPVIPSKFMSRSTLQRKILILDTDVIEMRVLQDIVFERLAKTNDSDKFYLKVYESLINKAPEFCSEVFNYA